MTTPGMVGDSSLNCSEVDKGEDDAASSSVPSPELHHCTDPWAGTLAKYSFATEGVGLFSVAIVGIVANLISIAVLTQRTMKSQISALLITLAVFDIFFLFCTFPVFTVQSVNGFVDYLNGCVYPDAKPIQFLSPWMTEIYNLSLPFLYGLTHVSKVGSVFTTLAVSLERYFAVCRPLWIRIRRMHPGLYIVIVTLFAFGFNIPKFMEFETTMIDNRTTVVATSLRTNEQYIVYYNFWTKTFLTELFPYVCLIFFNACIYREIRRSVKIQQIMRCTQSQKEEIKSANVVVGVVLLSILCHIWKIVPDLYEAIMKLKGKSMAPPTAATTEATENDCLWGGGVPQQPQQEEDAFNINIEFIIDTSHLLVGINSASNFFLYCLLRKNFRAATWRLLTCTPAPVTDAHMRQATVITRVSRHSSRRLNGDEGNGGGRGRGSCVGGVGGGVDRRRSHNGAAAALMIEDADAEKSFFEIDGIAMTDRTSPLMKTLSTSSSSHHHYHHPHLLTPHHEARLHHHSSIRSNKPSQAGGSSSSPSSTTPPSGTTTAGGGGGSSSSVRRDPCSSIRFTTTTSKGDSSSSSKGVVPAGSSIGAPGDGVGV